MWLYNRNVQILIGVLLLLIFFVILGFVIANNNNNGGRGGHDHHHHHDCCESSSDDECPHSMETVECSTREIENSSEKCKKRHPKKF
jgi:hypothetical protein